VEGEFVQHDVAAVSARCIRIGRQADDAGTVMGKYTSMVFSSVSNSANAGNAFNLLKSTQKSLTFSMNIRDWRSPLERMMYCVRLPRHLSTARSAAA
jgi:hypothetical protein